MVRQPEDERSKGRVIRQRVPVAAEGLHRVEVTVPANDARLVRAVAAGLRAGGEDARRVRDALASVTAIKPARTGAELLEFLRTSPLVGEELTVERDRATGRK